MNTVHKSNGNVLRDYWRDVMQNHQMNTADTALSITHDN